MAKQDGDLQRIQSAYAEWSAKKEGSFEHWMDMLADNVDFHSLAAGKPGMEFTAVCHCKDDVRNYFLGLAQDWEMQHFTPEHYIAEGDWIVMRGSCSWRNRRTNKVVETPKADFMRFKDGKVVEFHEFFDTAAALAAAR